MYVFSRKLVVDTNRWFRVWWKRQVAGEVYAVDESTLLVRKFVYDGNGIDTFFLAGSSLRPSLRGFLVPNEHGRTNVLRSYLNKDLTLRMPDGKTLNDIKWFSVYDLTLRVSRSLAFRFSFLDHDLST